MTYNYMQGERKTTDEPVLYYVAMSCKETLAIQVWEFVHPHLFTVLPVVTLEKWKAEDDSEDAVLINSRHVTARTAFLIDAEQAAIFFFPQWELGYVTKQAEQHSSFISSATCDSSEFQVLQEARLMLMCHQWGFLKTWFKQRGTADWFLITWADLITCCLSFHLLAGSFSITICFTS